MKAKYKVGDIVTVNGKYFIEGKAYFGKELKHKKFCGMITKIFENTNDEKDGHGEIWNNFYQFKNGIQICELFLRLA